MKDEETERKQVHALYSFRYLVIAIVIHRLVGSDLRFDMGVLCILTTRLF